MTQDPGPTSIDRAWGTAGATALLVAFTAVGALLSDAPGDRTGGSWFGALLAVGLLAAGLTRFRRGPMTWILCGMTVGQLAVGGLLMAQGTGAPKVVGALTAIFAAGWGVAALLMRGGGRSEGGSG